MKPVKVFGSYVVCCETADEDHSARSHFVGECGWTPAQFKKIAHFPWFRVEVSLWKDGKELALEHLGGCCYKTRDEFYTTYACDYFSDMVLTCAEQVKDPALLLEVNAWRESFRAEHKA